ncbi:MAG: type II toxin-antitoxin system Phd/YefM family antitoxin [Nitrospirae bacterium]|nr:type II toxin-antitoxin system Phd/YefM family antitoxin [Nitrospirota bacterium]MBI5696431.1 type II toxin-antitoxin system Phd/YefM family antitoxin [Nitrospirota bacterium]
MAGSATRHRVEGIGRVVPLSGLKKDILNIVTEVSEFDEKVTITKDGEPAVVMVNAEYYEGLIETLEILSDKKSVSGIRQSLKDIREGKVQTLDEVFG